MEIFTRTIGRERALSVFGFEDEAEVFFFLEGMDERWDLKETPAKELISLLLGACAHVDVVILDPLPDILQRLPANLIERKRFVSLLVSK